MYKAILKLLKKIFSQAVIGVFFSLFVMSSYTFADEDKTFINTDITGTHFGKGVSAVNDNGEPFTFDDLNGKVSVVFFGFTQCPDICPTAMAELYQLQTELTEEQKEQVQMVMVSVDPERDSPERLRSYVKAFDKSFMGVTGTPEQIKALADSFKVYYKKIARTNGRYDIEHSAGFYVLDQEGESRILFRPGATVEEMIHDLSILL